MQNSHFSFPRSFILMENMPQQGSSLHEAAGGLKNSKTLIKLHKKIRFETETDFKF